MAARRPTARERRLNAIYERDKTVWVTFGPAIASFANFIGCVWCVGMIYALAVGRAAAEAQILLAVAAVPVLLFCLVGRGIRRMAQRIKDERRAAAANRST